MAPLLRGRTLTFEIHNPFIGFFAQLTWCVSVLEYSKQRGLATQLSATGAQYRDPARSPNWLSYFFQVADAKQPVDFRISQWTELCMPARYLKRETIEGANELMKRHLPLQQEILSKLDRFCGQHFEGKKMLGVHFRGTDKTEEAPRVSWEAMRQTVLNYLNANREVNGLFVASDEPAFREYIRDSFPDLPVVGSQSSLAGNYKADLGVSNYQKGEEALLDCLLLSRCSALIRTTSFLSAWASIFNPKLPIVVVNRPYPNKLWFPEAALIPRSMDQYAPVDLLSKPLVARARLR
ncbi:MAG TPA: nodulation protein NodZ [Bryobacteraceae bacterium]|nr:nodulation protein NodZ [Bryobacteraceae bacterium]